MYSKTHFNIHFPLISAVSPTFGFKFSRIFLIQKHKIVCWVWIRWINAKTITQRNLWTEISTKYCVFDTHIEFLKHKIVAILYPDVHSGIADITKITATLVTAGLTVASMSLTAWKPATPGTPSTTRLPVTEGMLAASGKGCQKRAITCILLGPPGCTQAFPNLRPGLLNCFGVAPEE